MRLLLDTHAFIWSASSPKRLARAARSAIEDPANEVFVSAAVAWEIAIKHAMGKIELPAAPASWLPTRVQQLGFASLPITQQHVLATASLPAYHRDPFDRVMIAQAQVEGLTLVSGDARVLQYPVHVLKT